MFGRIFGLDQLFKILFFLEKLTDFTDYTDIRFFYRIFGFDRLFKILFFSDKITDLPIIRFDRFIRNFISIQIIYLCNLLSLATFLDLELRYQRWAKWKSGPPTSGRRSGASPLVNQ
jgi:hypothetical protein